MPKGISPVSPASPRSLRLRAELPKVMRLSPKAMTILGGVSCLAISAALWWGLRHAIGHEKTGEHQDQIGRAHAELQSLMRISFAVLCLQKKNTPRKHTEKQTQ